MSILELLLVYLNKPIQIWRRWTLQKEWHQACLCWTPYVCQTETHPTTKTTTNPLPLLLLHLVLTKLGKEWHLVDVAKRLQTGETSPGPNRVGNLQHHCRYPHPPHHNHPAEADKTSITYSWMMVWKNPSWPLLKVGKRNHTHHSQGQDHRSADKLQVEINIINLTSNSSWKILQMETNFLIL